MKKIFAVAVTIALIVVFNACYYDKEDLLYPGGSAIPCDTTAVVSYTQKVVPIFQQYCYGCHTGGAPSGNVAMGNYTADRAIASNGKLYGSVNHLSGYSPMPKNAVKLSACNIAIIKKWIDNGSPQN